METDINQYVRDGQVNVDEIVGAGTRVPAGRYNAKLIAVEGKKSKSSKDMIEARFEIQDGDQAGSDILAWYTLIVLAPKKAGQRPFAPGIVEMKTAFAAVGAPLAAGYGFPIDPHQASKVFAKHLGKKILDIAVIEEKSKDKDTGEEKVGTRVKILGLAKTRTTAANSNGATKAPPAEVEESVDDLI